MEVFRLKKSPFSFSDVSSFQFLVTVRTKEKVVVKVTTRAGNTQTPRRPAMATQLKRLLTTTKSIGGKTLNATSPTAGSGSEKSWLLSMKNARDAPQPSASTEAMVEMTISVGKWPVQRLM